MHIFIFYILFSFISKLNFSLECLSSYCLSVNNRAEHCHACNSVSPLLKDRWKLYIENLFPKLKSKISETICCNSGIYGYCVTHIMNKQGKKAVTLECSQKDDTLPVLKQSLCNSTTNSNLQCCTTDYCNLFSNLIFNPNQTTVQPHVQSNKLTVAYITIGLLTFLALVIICLFLYLKMFTGVTYQVSLAQPRSVVAESLESGIVVSGLEKPDISESPIDEKLLSEMWSGSGRGGGLIDRCLLNDVTLLQRIGQGRFGEVWRGTWSVLTCEVAVKIFHSVEERAWTRERFIFRLDLFPHVNILHFLGSDTVDSGNSTRLCIITEYHAFGSLLDYLQNRCISTVKDLLSKSLDIASGLSYLHQEINANERKPVIAHRDIKSANILVKSTGQLCLADFTSSICAYSSGRVVKQSSWYRECTLAGTIRYAAPEILDGSVILDGGSLILNGFCVAEWAAVKSYQMTDIYSLALVYWEMLNRCEELLNRSAFYSKPYSIYAPDNPSQQDMHHIVCTRGIRPEMESCWYQGQTASFCRIMTECWSPNPSNRLTSFNIKKQLQKQLFIL